jgi:hypothetical protein
MRRFLHLALFVICLIASPVFAQDTPPDWPGVYPRVLAGYPTFESGGNLSVTVTEIEFMPWSAPSMADSGLSYRGTWTIDGDTLAVTLTGLYDRLGRLTAPSPRDYMDGAAFAFLPEMGAYGRVVTTGPTTTFEAWTWNQYGWIWTTGCLGYTGSAYPWWDVSPACIWVRLEPTPEAARLGRETAR